MKETRYFYVPDVTSKDELPYEEAMHALRVLRMKSGDEMVLMDGCGNYFQAVVTVATTHHCMYKVINEMPQQPQWKGHLHIGIAPTKMIDRMEWMLEKATEIGIDEISFLNCKNSERRIIKKARLDKILISAMKQSRKAWKPVINDMESFEKFVDNKNIGHRFIAHCYDEIPRTYLFDELRNCTDNEERTVLIGPEGDFSLDEVRAAIGAGYISVHLGRSRLRTETAAIAAIMMLHLSHNQ